MDFNQASHISSSETSDKMLRLHSEELTKIRKLRLVINELKRIDCSKLILSDKEEVKKAITCIKIGEYLYLNDKKDQVLNIGKVNCINLNYTERKALRQLLSINLVKELENIHDFSSKLRTELPEVFSDKESLHAQILLLEKKRRNNFENLIKLRNRKCNFLKVAAELKMGPYLACELEVMLAKAHQNQTKINILRGYFINDLLTRTEHSLKAVREVEGYINNVVDKDPEDSK